MPDVLARCTWYCSIATKPHQTLPTPKKNTHTQKYRKTMVNMIGYLSTLGLNRKLHSSLQFNDKFQNRWM